MNLMSIFAELSLDSVDYEKGIKSVQSGASDAEKANESLAKSTSSLESKLSSLSKEFDDNKTTLSKLNSELNEAITKYGKNSSEASALASDIAKLENEQSALEKQISATTSDLEKQTTSTNKLETAMSSVSKASGVLNTAISKVTSVAKTAALGFAAIVGTLSGVSIATIEYREEMNKLRTAFDSNNKSTLEAKQIYEDFYGILGETDQSVEAVSHLAELTNNQEELSKWTDISAGVLSKFGDSLPLEGLTEAASVTATLGEVTGPLTDAFEFAGYSVDDFNSELAELSTSEERATLITEKLNEIYGETGEAFREANAEVIAYREAQSKLSEGLAILGYAFQPVTTAITNFGAEALSYLGHEVENLVYVFQNEGLDAAVEDFAATIGYWVGELANYMPKIVEVAGNIVKSLIDGIGEKLPDIVDSAVDIMTTLTNSILDMLPDLLQLGIDLIVSLAEGLAEALPDLIPKIVNTLIDLFLTITDSDNIQKITDAAVALVFGLVEGIIKSFTSVEEGSNGLLEILFNVLSGGAGLLTKVGWALIKSLMSALWEAIPTDLKEWGNNVITSIKDFFTGIPKWFDNLWGEVSDFFVDAWEGILDFFEDVVDGFEEGLESIGDFFVELWEGIIEFFTETVPEKISEGIEAIVNFFLTLPERLGYLLGMVLAIIANFAISVFNFFTVTIPEYFLAFIEFMKTLPAKIWDVFLLIVEKWWALLAYIKDFFVNLWATVTENLANLLIGIKDFFVNLWDTIVEYFERMVTLVSDFIVDVVNFFVSLPGKIWNAITGTIQKIKDWVADMIATAKVEVPKFVTNVVDTIKGIPGKMLDIGKDIVEGLWNGMSSLTSWIGDKIKNFASGIAKGFTDFFGIKSPSRLMKGYGINIDEGLVLGLEEEQEAVNKAMQDIIDPLNTNGNFNFAADYTTNATTKASEQPIIVQSILDGEKISENQSKITYKKDIQRMFA